MGSRSYASMGIVAVFVAVVVLSSEFVRAQAPTSARKTGQAAKTYSAPRTPDGQPDLQGYWSNTTYTPLQRPNDVTKAFYTKEEAEEALKRAAATESEQTEPGTIPDVHYDFTQFGLDRSQSALVLDLRTSLIVDPPDGKLPSLSAEGQRQAAERAEARKRMGGPYDAAQNQSLAVRCINMDRDGPPMLAGAYNNNYQILQAPGYVMILAEMLHDVRVIPLDKRPPPPESVRLLKGSSSGRWEGETLV